MKIAQRIIAMTMIALLATSCSDDDDVTIEESHLTTGTWVFSSAKIDDSTSKAVLEAFYEGATYEFSEDGTFSEVFLDYESTGDWTFSDNELVLYAGTEDEEVYEVTELSSSTLRLFTPETEEDGETVPAFTLIFKKS